MVLTIILVAVAVACLGVIAWLAFRKLPQIRVVDPSSSKEAKSKELKYAILKQRIERIGSERAETIKRSVLQPVGSTLQNTVRKVAGRLTAIERKYAEKAKSGGEKQHNHEVLRSLLREAAELMDDGRYDAAEKKLIEVVSHDPKNAAAYERLGRLYLLNKDYDAARETLLFLTKLSPNDASVLAALGEVAEAKGLNEEAVKYYDQALEASPNNPRYLDFAIEATIISGDLHRATELVDRLRGVNPENAKIAEFEEKIDVERKKKLG